MQLAEIKRKLGRGLGPRAGPSSAWAGGARAVQIYGDDGFIAQCASRPRPGGIGRPTRRAASAAVQASTTVSKARPSTRHCPSCRLSCPMRWFKRTRAPLACNQAAAGSASRSLSGLRPAADQMSQDPRTERLSIREGIPSRWHWTCRRIQRGHAQRVYQLLAHRLGKSAHRSATVSRESQRNPHRQDSAMSQQAQAITPAPLPAGQHRKPERQQRMSGRQTQASVRIAKAQRQALQDSIEWHAHSGSSRPGFGGRRRSVCADRCQASGLDRLHLTPRVRGRPIARPSRTG